MAVAVVGPYTRTPTHMEAALAAVIARERLLKDHNSPDPLREIFKPVLGRQEGADKP